MASPDPGLRRSGRTRHAPINYKPSQYISHFTSDDEDLISEEDEGSDGSADFSRNNDADLINEPEDFLPTSESDDDDEGDDDEDDDQDGDFKVRKRRTFGTGGRTVTKPLLLPTSDSRGLFRRVKSSIPTLRRSLYGPDPADQQPAVQHLNHWRPEHLLPSRLADASGAGGYHKSFYHTDEKQKLESEVDWVWYENGGRHAFRRQQVQVPLDSVAAGSYLPSSEAVQEVLLGPYDEQRIFKITKDTPLDINEPFNTSQDGSSAALSRRNGWLLNMGECIRNLAWVPRRGGREQFLAVTTSPIRDPKAPIPGTNGQLPSSFRPQAPTKSAIRILRFRTGDGNYIDTSQPPFVQHVICTDWGDIRSIKWCPMPRRERDNGDSSIYLGLLAGIWADGAVRILDIEILHSDETTYSHLKTAAFTARPPEAIFTTIAWMSPHGICAGASDGSLAIFDIAAHLKSSNPAEMAEPIIYHFVQPSYITALTTCYPSRPHMIIAASPSGCCSLTDLSKVSTTTGFNASNTVFGPRSRILKTVLTWHDWSQTALLSDDSCIVYALPPRRFFSISGVSKTRSMPMAMAVSECHPFVAAAGAAGEVTILNPSRRTFTVKSEMITLRWFQHEWKRATPPRLFFPNVIAQNSDVEADASRLAFDASTDEPADDGKGGLVRILEGFREEQVSSARQAKTDGPDGPLSGVHTTIYETQSAATALSWNPNLHVGGWIAAGMGTGLLRVEDIGVDAE